MTSLHCGIIGCGVIAPSHIESYRHLPDVTVTWACDIVQAKASALARQYQIPHVTPDCAEMLADPELDAVSVCTDHGSHAAIVIAALEAGKHVLCEKALTINRSSLDAMLQVQARHPELVFAGVFQHRYEAVPRLLKELLERGAFGTVSNLSLQSNCWRGPDYYRHDAWRGTWAHEGGALLINQAIHFIDLFQWLGGGIASLCARCDDLCHQGVIETEDAAAAAVRFKNGALGTVVATSSSAEDWRHLLTVSGTEGYAELCNDELIHYHFTKPEIKAEVERRLQADRTEKAIHAGKTYYGGGHPAQIQDFVAAIREHRPPFVTAATAREAVDVVLACYESSRSGSWVTLPE